MSRQILQLFSFSHLSQTPTIAMIWWHLPLLSHPMSNVFISEFHCEQATWSCQHLSELSHHYPLVKWSWEQHVEMIVVELRPIFAPDSGIADVLVSGRIVTTRIGFLVLTCVCRHSMGTLNYWTEQYSPHNHQVVGLLMWRSAGDCRQFQFPL